MLALVIAKLKGKNPQSNKDKKNKNKQYFKQEGHAGQRAKVTSLGWHGQDCSRTELESESGVPISAPTILLLLGAPPTQHPLPAALGLYWVLNGLLETWHLPPFLF